MGKRSTITMAALAAFWVPAAATAGPDCLCRADGRFYDQGDVTCIRTATGPKLAKCEMAQNVTTWNVVGDSCPLARVVPGLSGQVDFVALLSPARFPTAPISEVGEIVAATN